MKIKSIVMLSLAAIATSLTAMPTEQELKQVEGLVQELMRPELDAFKAGKKTRADVAKSAIALAEKAESDAAKMLLLKGSFTFYVGHGAFDEAIGVLKTLKTTIPDIPPENMANMIESALRNMPKSKGGLIYRLLDDTKSYVRHQDELKNALAKSKKRPSDKTLHLKIAELYVSLGDWDKALDEFAKGDNPKAAEAAKAEKGEGKMPKSAIADFWWSYTANGEEEQQKKFKRHAAAIYAEAINSGDASGLVKVKAQRHIDEVKGYGDDMLAGVITSPASEVAGNSHPSTGNLYCVVDLSAGPNATKYPVSYLAAEPKGGWTDEYKTTKLVLRRIEPGKFMMGGKYEVTLTKPFYCGVFEVTQKQYELVTGANPSSTKGDMRSVGNVSWNAVRGNSATYNWPSSVNVDPSTFIGKIQARTSLNIDLPTEAQWEYACWAGTTNDDNIAKHIPDGKRGYPMVVGSYSPNAWGLYDMHENVWEWCLDWSNRRDKVLILSSGVTDPVGPSSGEFRVIRGGCWDNRVGGYASSSRNHANPVWVKYAVGFRLVIAPDLLKERGIKPSALGKVQLWEGGPYWAEMNIGAKKPEDHGYYFWWGDTIGYKRENDAWVANDGSSSNFSFEEKNTPTFGKSQQVLRNEGWITVDGVLTPQHDAAHVQWGGGWRMPTTQELSGLTNKCDWTWTTQNGVKGYVVRGRGDYASNSIFLPCAGFGNGTSLTVSGSYGGYWSSVPGSNGSYDSWNLGFNSRVHVTDANGRHGGRTVRPVQGFAK